MSILSWRNNFITVRMLGTDHRWTGWEAFSKIVDCPKLDFWCGECLLSVSFLPIPYPNQEAQGFHIFPLCPIKADMWKTSNSHTKLYMTVNTGQGLKETQIPALPFAGLLTVLSLSYLTCKMKIMILPNRSLFLWLLLLTVIEQANCSELEDLHGLASLFLPNTGSNVWFWSGSSPVSQGLKDSALPFCGVTVFDKQTLRFLKESHACFHYLDPEAMTLLRMDPSGLDPIYLDPKVLE